MALKSSSTPTYHFVLTLRHTLLPPTVLSHFWETSCCCLWHGYPTSIHVFIYWNSTCPSRSVFSTELYLILFPHDTLDMQFPPFNPNSSYFYVSYNYIYSIEYFLFTYFNENSIKERKMQYFTYITYNVYGWLVLNSPIKWTGVVIYAIFVTLCNLLFTITSATSPRGILTLLVSESHRISVLESTLNVI